mmetsp:Transcript_44436/g.107491  ORF Transcript_44436/g.107491 Transcript_44436/m.107491 type:complete len:680 (-) Transcript_44436:2136-4175(-)
MMTKQRRRRFGSSSDSSSGDGDDHDSGHGQHRVLISLVSWLVGMILIGINVKIITRIQNNTNGAGRMIYEESLSSEPPPPPAAQTEKNDAMLQFMLNRIDLMTMPFVDSAYYFKNNNTSSRGGRMNSRRGGSGATTVSVPFVGGGGDNNININRNRSSNETNSCSCNLLSLDCLDAIRCLGTQTQQHRYATSFVGIQLRRTIKETASYERRWINEGDNPVGKQLQYSAISTWSVWRKGFEMTKFDRREFYKPLVLPVEYDSTDKSAFVAHKWYPTCQEFKLRGKSCFFTALSHREDLAGATWERRSLRWAMKSKKYLAQQQKEQQQIPPPPPSSSLSATQTDTNRRSSRPNLHPAIQDRLHDLISIVKQSALPLSSTTIQLRALDEDQKTLSPMGELLSFAHIMRILFNRRPFLDKIFQSHLTSIRTKTGSTPTSTKRSSSIDPFVVSVHIRRGDSCTEKNPRRYQRKESPIDSPPQTSANRYCYMTSVYLNAVQRITDMVPSDRPVHVYLSTDDVGSVMNEIQLEHPDVFESVDEWRFLNYSRSHFQYTTDFIEDYENEKRPILGETAVADLWLLSHGEAFVGHLGSRFGKAGWLLATARRNNLIPYFSVDGHNFCCEIDEDCGKMSSYVTDMDNCLTFGHDYLDFDLGDKYWDHGSWARKWAYEKKTRKNNGNARIF